MGHSYIFLLIIMQEKLIYFQKMTSCKLRVKLRVTFSELFVEEYRKIELVVRSFIAILGHQTDYIIMQFLKSAKF